MGFERPVRRRLSVVAGVLFLALTLASTESRAAEGPLAENEVSALEEQLVEAEGPERLPILVGLLALNRTNPVSDASAHGIEALEWLQRSPNRALELTTRLDLSWALSSEGDSEQAATQAELARLLAGDLRDTAHLALAHYHLGVAHWYSSDIPLALEHSETALRLQREHDLQAAAAKTHTLLGAIQRSRSDYEAALDHHLQALAIAEALGDASGVARSRNNLGLLYRELSQPDRALDHFRHAGDYYREQGSDARLAAALNNLGFTLIELEKVREALVYLEEGLTLHESLERPRSRARLLSNMAFAHEVLDDPDQAMVFHEEALALRLEVQDNRGTARTLANIASIEKDRGLLVDAEQHFARALQLAESSDARMEQQEILALMAEVFEAQGRHQEALTAFRRHREIRDALDRDKAAIRIAELESSREVALRELDLNREKNRVTVLMLITALSFVLIAGLLAYNRSRNRSLALLTAGHEKLAEATQRLEESEQRYRSLFYDEVVPKLLIDIESRQLVDANTPAARLCNTSASKLRSLPVEELQPAWLQRAAGSCEAVADEVVSMSGSYEIDGAERQAEVRLAPVAVGGRASVVLTVHDITEKRRLEEERIRVDKLESLGLLAGGIAHDFNNALAVILGHLGLARLEAKDNPKIVPLLSQAESAVDQTVLLTRQLLAFASGGEPQRELHDVGEHLRSAVGFALSGASTGLELEIRQPLWLAELDLGQFKQLVSNLVINAVQAMDGEGSLRVSAENHIARQALGQAAGAGDYIRIEVADSGPGIPVEIQTKVMDPYFTTKAAGSGLGLPTAFAIVSRHDGWLDFQAREGVGTTFNIYLPASPAANLQETEGRAEGSQRGTERILVMDDDESVRNVYRAFLEEMGYSVEVAANGNEALDLYIEAARSGRAFDVVILDLTVPGGMGGKATMEALRREDPQVLGIVASGYSNDPVMASHEEFGFAAAMTKPFMLDEIARVVREILDRR